MILNCETKIAEPQILNGKLGASVARFEAGNPRATEHRP